MALSEITNYVEDDWDDNNLTGRTNSSEGYFLHPSDGLLSGDMEAGDALKGVYRPDWQIESGSPTATNNELQFSAGDSTLQDVSSPSEFTVGSWKWDFIVNSSTSTNSLNFVIMSLDTNLDSFGRSNNCYNMIATAGGQYRLQKQVSNANTDLIIGSYSNGVTETGEATRDSYNNFELFVNSTSQGTTTDSEFNDSVYVNLGNSLDSSVDVDNLVIK